MRKKKNRRVTVNHAAVRPGGEVPTPHILRAQRPPEVSKDVWAAYGPMYPGSALRWEKRMAELKGTQLDPFRERPAPGPVIHLTNYVDLQRRAAELYERVFGCPPSEVAA